MNITTLTNQCNTQYDLKKREIQIVIEHVLNINSAALMIYDNPLTKNQITAIHQNLKKRQNGVPFAYITGLKDFWSLTLQVNKYTLIPRPETELIVEYVLSKTTKDFRGSILDLGTGTGAIALSLAVERPYAHITAIDKCSHCVDTAIINKNIYNLQNVKIHQSNWFDNISGKKFDFIISNPPYITPNDEHLLNLKFEPHSALVANENGYSDLSHIILHAPQFMKTNTQLILEHGYNQAQTVHKKLHRSNYVNINTIQDLARIDRITTAQAPKSCY